MNNQVFSLPNSWVGEKLNILFVGCGGTGGELLTRLFKMNNILKAIGHEGLHITAFDGDTVSRANVGRQPFYSQDIGVNKAEVLISRFNQVSNVGWQSESRYLDVKEIKARQAGIAAYQLLITSVDSAELRAKIGASFKDTVTNMLWLDVGNDRNSGQVILGHLGRLTKSGSLRLPNVFDLFPTLSEIKDDKTESCSVEEAIFKQDFGINSLAAECCSNLLWRLLREGKLNEHGVFFNSNPIEVNTMAIDEQQWAMFGYTQNSTKKKLKEA